MKNLIGMLSLMSVLICLSTETIAQNKDTMIYEMVPGILVGGGYTTIKTPADWYLGASLQFLVSHDIKSEKEEKDTQIIIINLELSRVAGRWYNEVGYSLFSRAVYSLNAYTVAKWKFPLEFFAYGEYSWKKTDGVVAGGFISVGPQTKLADDSIIALTFGSPTAEWKPSIGLLVVYPLMKKL